MGRYLRFLDPRTGRVLGHRIYEGSYRRKRDGEWINLPPKKWKAPPVTGSLITAPGGREGGQNHEQEWPAVNLHRAGLTGAYG